MHLIADNIIILISLILLLFTSHYTVFAVPVYRGPNAPRSAPYTPSFPYSQLVIKSVSAHLASEAVKPIPFIVGQYEGSSLPDKLVFDGSWRKRAFKPETNYAFVVAAYSKTKASCVVRGVCQWWFHPGMIVHWYWYSW